MGVRGLNSLLRRHGRIYRDTELRCSRLVVDGSNLVHILYFSSGLDQNRGGDYASLAALTERFVAALRRCHVAPYVLLDGGGEPSDRKLDTCLQRCRQRVLSAHDAALTGDPRGVLPPLATRVFKQTLARLRVPTAQCYAEADQEVAALAAEWRCPVLSDDSDFYVFELPGGLLPTAHFLWQQVQPAGPRRSVPCKSYGAASFCCYFGIQRPLLPAFAALAGNDYVKLQIDWSGGGVAPRLDGLLSWLRRFQQPAAALQAALDLLEQQGAPGGPGGPGGPASRAALMDRLVVAMEEYQLHDSALSRYFTHGTPPPLPRPHQGAPPVPDWLRLPLTQVKLTADVLDVLRLRRMNLSVTVATGELPSANRASRPLRQLLYGLLLGGRRPPPVEERDRQGLEVVFVQVEPVLSGAASRLRLDSLHQEALPARLQVLLEALGVSQDALRPLPPQLRLPLAVTCYWRQNARPAPDLLLLKALLQGLNMAATTATATAGLQNGSRGQTHLDLDAVHAFSQWQICLKDALHLNQLLDFPLVEPDVACLFQGTLVHQLLATVRAGGRPRRLLRSDHARLQLYRHMLAAVLRSGSQAGSAARVEVEARRRERRSLSGLDANLQLRWLFEEEEVRSAARVQEEVQLEERLTVKTRYRTKRRSNRSNKAQRGVDFL